ncbi:MAG: stage II sporulation protein P [Oscillospiraceae bacterium]|nr:stage II sporulation protein P [Oscillospiraceae bacterium]
MYYKKSQKAARIGVLIVIFELILIAAIVAVLVLTFSEERANAIMQSEIPAMLMKLGTPFTIVSREQRAQPDVPMGKPVPPEPEKTPEKEENPLVYTPPERAETPPEPVKIGYSDEGITLMNRTDWEIDIGKYLDMPLPFDTENLTVLIIHTHATEAFTMTESDTYEPSEPYRTIDETHSVIRVGDELERILSERGVRVIHDKGLYDYPNYNNSYTRALESIKAHLADDDTIKVVIDLHRDALEGENGRVYKTVADIGETPSAQIEIISGTNYSGLNHPNWEGNLSFAMKLQAEMVASYPTLARPLQISQYRYNQHLTPGSLIVEVGCSGNTLSEAVTAVGYFADCMASVLGK